MRFEITPAPPETVDGRAKNQILAHANLIFDDSDGLLAGAMLTGFTIVQPRTGLAEAWLPARIYAVNLNGRVKTGHLWAPQNRPFPAARDWS